MVTTGYSDTFNRTVSNGLGTATSGQAYTLLGTNTQFSVAPSTASIAITVAGDNLGYVDMLTPSIDITGQVALSALPATNQSLAGFVGMLSNTSNYYGAAMQVSSAGAVSIRFFKRIAGVLTTLTTTVITGLTYVANTFYNLEFSIFWSQQLQTNILSAKLWVVGGTATGGWQATTTDAALTQYTAGTSVGIIGRDEAAAVGSVTTKYRSVSVRSYSLPMPATTDPMCFDPAVTYPRQTAVQTLAVAADAAMATLDPLAALAALYPRVRISNSLFTINSAAGFITIPFGATEFNIGTPTNLGFDPNNIYLPVGIWLVTFEIQLVEAAADAIQIFFTGGPLIDQLEVVMRSNPTQSNDQGVGGTGHLSLLTFSTNPALPVKISVVAAPASSSAVYTVTYAALSAVKISDYFT